MADFQEHLADLQALGASVVALSTDSEEKARETVARTGATFPIMHGLDGPATAELLDAYYEARRNIIQPSNFILKPDRTIMSITHSSGPVGRVVAEDAIRIITFYQKQAAA